MKKVVRIIANKYFLAGVAFVAWLSFFDQSDWMTLQQRQKELNGVKDNIAYLKAEINTMAEEKNALMTDPHRLEQYARENYRMKQPGEDVYVIEK
ncbi:MAG: septum formation initiator family protein [Bacteroidota bacterium]